MAHNAQRNLLFIDAGALALSKDGSPRGTNDDVGYRLLVIAINYEPLSDLYVQDTNQEHGMVTTLSGNPINFGKFSIGKVVVSQPYHADTTAACDDPYHVCCDGFVTEIWHRDNGW